MVYASEAGELTVRRNRDKLTKEQYEEYRQYYFFCVMVVVVERGNPETLQVVTEGKTLSWMEYREKIENTFDISGVVKYNILMIAEYAVRKGLSDLAYQYKNVCPD